MATTTRLEPALSKPRSAAPPWGHALANRRFRSLLLAIAGVPIGVAYAWYGVLWPLVWNQVSDFRQWYFEGARIIASGGDPYRCTATYCTGETQQWLGAAGAIYPPFALWVIQPVARFDPTVVNGVALVAANLCLALFLVLVIRALGVRDWQERTLIVLLCVSFAPTLTEVQNRNMQLVLLALSPLVVMAWRLGDRWWGGLALGIGLAVKLVEAPILLLGAWGRRSWFVLTALVSWALLWLVAVPGLLPEYLFQVLPSVGRGSGAEMNVAPLGTVARIFHPESLYQQGRGVDFPVLAVTAAIGAAVLLLTAWYLRRPRVDPAGRSLEVAAAFAAMPLVLTLVWAGQLILLLLPMIVLLDLGLRIRSRRLLLAVATSWVLIGPVYLAFTNAFAVGFGVALLFQVWSASAVAGVAILWFASLHALRVAPAPS